MSKQFQGLRTLGYKVPDLQEAKKWYTDVLGVEPYFDEHFYVGFNVAGYEQGMHVYDRVHYGLQHDPGTKGDAHTHRKTQAALAQQADEIVGVG